MKQPNISPDAYQSILKRIELKDLSIIESKTKLNEEFHAPKLELKINDNSTFETTENEFRVFSRYTFKAKGEEKSSPFVEMVVKFQLIYDLRDCPEISKDFFDIYEELSLGFIIWPYFREFVQNMLSRMNLPHLTLPMRKAIKG